MSEPKYFNKKIPGGSYWPEPEEWAPLPGQISLEDLDKSELFTNCPEEEELPEEFTTI